MKYSRGFKFLLGAALISTLGFKLLLKPATSSENPTAAAQSRLADFLTRQHFRVSVVRRQASAGDEVFVLYRGKIYDEQPTLRTVSDFLWGRVLRELGISSAERAVYAIISPKSCNATVLPWDELAGLDHTRSPV